MSSFFKKWKGKGRDRHDEDARSDAQGAKSNVSDEAAGPTPSNEQQSPVKRFGISELSGSESEDAVDVVLVHGLMGHPHDTWCHSDSNTKFFWPAHITEDIADVRVMTSGYDADPSSILGRVGQNRLGEHAYDLLNAMERQILSIVQYCGSRTV